MSHDNQGFTPDYDPNRGSTLNKSDNRGPSHLSATSIYLTDTTNKKSSRKDLEAEQYDPYDHRDVSHPISNTDALFHMMKASCGTGILAMPLAFMHAGYAIGLVGTILIGSICTYCVHILIQSEYELCRRRKIPSLTYPDIAYEAFREGPTSLRPLASLARHLVNFFLTLYQVGGCGVYTLFIAQNIKEVVDQHTPVEQHFSLKLYMCALLVPLILVNWIRNLKLLAPCSTIAVALTVLAFGAVVYYVFRGLPSISEREPVGELKNLPLFFGTVIFALEAIGVIIPLENEMRTPKKFRGVCGVLNQGMIPIVFMYTFLGFFGYIHFGNESQGSITLNLPNEPFSVNLFIGIYQFGACSVYTLFIAENIKAVVDQYTLPEQHWDVKVYMFILLVPLILINWIRNLKLLAPCSTFAVSITILAFGVVLYYVFHDLPAVSERQPVGKIGNMPLFFGTVIFALEAIGVIVPLENEMRTPKKFKGVFGVLNQGMVPIVCLYTFLGFFGYIQYGYEAKGSVTLNLPPEPLADSVKVLIALAIFGTHPLQCYVVIDIIWNIYLAPLLLKHPRVLLMEMGVRTAIVVATTLVAVAIPNLGPFISLIGALSLSIAGILLPAAIQLTTFWNERKGISFIWLLVRNIFLTLFAILGLVTGTYSSILEIIGEK